MALIQCSECGKEYSTDAKACPHCGKRRTSLITKIIGVFIILVAISAVIGSIKSNTMKDEAAQKEASRRASLTPQQRVAEDAKQAKEKRLDVASAVCEAAMKQALYDPDSAKLKPRYEWFAEERKDGTILVQPTGRAKNAFGAYVIGAWNCIAKNGNVMSTKQIRP